MISLVGRTLISLGGLWAALSWLVPAYLLKPPPDDPDGELKLTMPRLTRVSLAVLVVGVVACVVVVRELIVL